MFSIYYTDWKVGGSNAKFLTSKEMKTAFLLLLLLSFAVAVFGVAYFQYCSLSIRWMMVDWLWPMDLCRYCACVVAREEDCSQFLRCTQLLRLVLQLFQTCFFCFSLRFYFTSLFPRRYPTYVFRTQNLEHFTTGFWFHYFASSIIERHALRAGGDGEQ